MQSAGLNSALNPVVHGNIVLSKKIKKINKYTITGILFFNFCKNMSLLSTNLV